MKKAGYTSESYASDYLPGKSIYQSDARIFHRAGFEYDWVTEVVSAKANGRQWTATVKLRQGGTATLRLISYAPDVVRLQFGAGPFDETSPMLVPPPKRAPAVRARRTPGGWEIAFGQRRVCVGRKPFTLTVAGFELETEKIAGEPSTAPLGFRRYGKRVEAFVSWRIHNADRFFGLGEKWNKVEKSSTRATIWSADTCGSNTNDMSYKSLPLLHCTAGWGLMVHSSFRQSWEVGAFSYTAGSVLVEDGKLDAFLFFAPTLKKLIGRYVELTGKPQLPPRWALGVWLSRCAYNSRAEVEEATVEMRRRRIPCDVVHIDPMWMRTHYYFKIGVDACDFVRNDEKFPDLPGLFRQLRAANFRTCLWVNPYLPGGQPIYEEAKRRGFLAKSEKGGIARLEHGQPVGIVDFTNPAAKEWWKERIRQLLRDGAVVVKPDYGDRVPEDALFFNGRTGREIHNLYLHLYAEACFEAAQEVHGAGIVWRRAGYLGTQRYPGTWAGDTQVSWEAMRCCLRGGLAAGFGAEAFWSHDIAGFVGPKPPTELYIRWMQWGMFSPFCRFHGTTPREPWHYGPVAVRNTRHYAEWSYRLHPYWWKLAQEATRTGVPLLRHMALEFPNEPGVENIDDQYLLGPDLLVAPVLNAGQRSRPVYFPTGEWVALEDRRKGFAGPRYHDVPVPLERIPVFVRAGAKLPVFADVPQHLQGQLPAVKLWQF